jgi:fructose/tagatose bisphosphate aldolase
MKRVGVKMVIANVKSVRELYKEAGQRGWVLPCICSENLTTTEAILSAAFEFGKEHVISDLPITIAITCNYSHRSQAPYYTNTRLTNLGLNLFKNDIKTLTSYGSPYEDLRVMIHLDHIQYDSDIELLNSDLSDYSSIMYDASALPFDENIKFTAEFVARNADKILIEGACDEIMDATGSQHNSLTTPENALKYAAQTGVDLIVANLGTEHRATGKELKYNGELARQIKDKIGSKIVLHGTSSVTNEQVKSLYNDGICKVNIWTALERDASPILFEELVRNASKVSGIDTVDKLIREGYLTEKCRTGDKTSISHFTTTYRQEIVFNEMKKMVRAYLDMWYI